MVSMLGWSTHAAALLPSAVGCGLMHLGLCMGVTGVLARPSSRDSSQQHGTAVVKVFTGIRLLVQLVLATAVVCSIALHSSSGSSSSSSSSSSINGQCLHCEALFKAAAAVLPLPLASQPLPRTPSTTAAAAAEGHSTSSRGSEHQECLVMQLLLHSLVSAAVYQVPWRTARLLLALEAPLAVTAAISAHPSGAAYLAAAAAGLWQHVPAAATEAAATWGGYSWLLAALVTAAAAVVASGGPRRLGFRVIVWRLLGGSWLWRRPAAGGVTRVGSAPPDVPMQQAHRHPHDQQQQDTLGGQPAAAPSVMKAAPAPAGEEPAADVALRHQQPQRWQLTNGNSASNSASSSSIRRRQIGSSGSGSVAVHPSRDSSTSTNFRRGHMATLVPDRSSISSITARDEARSFSRQRLAAAPTAPPDAEWQFDSPFLPRIHTSQQHSSRPGSAARRPAGAGEPAAGEPAGAMARAIPKPPMPPAAASRRAAAAAAAAASDGQESDSHQQRQLHYHSRRQSTSSYSVSSLNSGSGTGQPRSNPSSTAADGFLSALNRATGDARSATTASSTNADGVLPQQRQRRSLDEVGQSIQAAVSNRVQQEQLQEQQGHQQFGQQQLQPSSLAGVSVKQGHGSMGSFTDGSTHDLRRCPSFRGMATNDTMNAAWFNSSNSFSGSSVGPSGLRGASFTAPVTPLSDPGAPRVTPASPSDSFTAGNFTLPWQPQPPGLPPRPFLQLGQADDSVSSTEGMLRVMGADAGGGQGPSPYPDLYPLSPDNSFNSSSSVMGRPAWGHQQPCFTAPSALQPPPAVAGLLGSGIQDANPWLHAPALGHSGVTGWHPVGVPALEEVHSGPHTPATSDAGLPYTRDTLRRLQQMQGLEHQDLAGVQLQLQQQQQRHEVWTAPAPAAPVPAAPTDHVTGAAQGRLERAATMAFDPSVGLLFSATSLAAPTAAAGARPGPGHGPTPTASHMQDHASVVQSDPGCGMFHGGWAAAAETAGAGAGAAVSQGVGGARPYRSAFAGAHHQQLMQEFMVALHHSYQG